MLSEPLNLEIVHICFTLAFMFLLVFIFNLL